MFFRRDFRSSDLFLALFILSVTGMLIVPLPTPLLDLLIVVNFAVSILLLLSGLYLPHALALLSFPSLLLLTTLFRLAINVASTRLILLQADAGRVIEAFGQYLVQGQVVIGLIIFFILSAVNFIVISRGAARVSEVAARFTLDSLPGRQASIDSDLRSGLISAEEAQTLRENLSKESQLYGAMDGAMKFVQGDAIVGLIVIFVNLLGGLYIGVSSGMTFGDAIHTYSVLTVGDGLVNQVPAILIAICAGLVVTRVAESNSASLAEDVRSQVFAKPGFLLFAAAILISFSFVEGIPAIPFLAVAFLLAAIAWRQNRTAGSKPAIRQKASLALSAGSSLMLPQSERIILLEVDSLRLYPKWLKQSAAFESWWEVSRQQASGFFGLPLPRLVVRASQNMRAGEYTFKIDNTAVLNGVLDSKNYLIELSSVCADFFGIKDFEISTHPLFDKKVIAADLDSKQRNFLRLGGVRFYDPFQIMALSLLRFSQLNPQEFYSVSDLIGLEARLERSKPGLLNGILPRQFFSAARITEIACELSRQGIYFSDYLSLAELLSQYTATVGSALISEGEFDLTDIVSFIRTVRFRQILSPCMNIRGRLAVLTTDQLVDNQVLELPRQRISEVFDRSVLQSLKDLVLDFGRQGESFPVLEVRDDLRPRYQEIISNCRLPVRVVSSEELKKTASFEYFGSWQLRSTS